MSKLKEILLGGILSGGLGLAGCVNNGDVLDVERFRVAEGSYSHTNSSSAGTSKPYSASSSAHSIPLSLKESGNGKMEADLGLVKVAASPDDNTLNVRVPYLPAFLYFPISQDQTIFESDRDTFSRGFIDESDLAQLGSNYHDERNRSLSGSALGKFGRYVLFNNVKPLREVAQTASRISDMPVRWAFGENVSTIFELDVRDFGGGLDVQGIRLGARYKEIGCCRERKWSCGVEHMQLGDYEAGNFTSLFLAVKW